MLRRQNAEGVAGRGGLPKTPHRTSEDTKNFETPDETSAPERLSRIGTIARTRRLLMAALRVWELKNGIRDG